jgi:tRNA 2-thiouridine synthesizing protein D
MKFAIQINNSPYQSNTGHTAYQFIKAVLAQGHEVFRVFFYQDGIYHAFKYATPPDDAKRQGKMDNDLAEGFRISGLGQLVEATLEADRFIVFG